MDQLFALINAAACGLIALVLIGCVISPRVHDGVVIKTGLISMSLGFGSVSLQMLKGLEPNDLEGLARSILLITAGIAVVIFGYLLRRARVRHPIRRATDWGELDPLERNAS